LKLIFHAKPSTYYYLLRALHQAITHGNGIWQRNYEHLPTVDGAAYRLVHYG